ncbi:hypothetical protein [Jeongeupia chitinilytica]|uniref:Lipoprotein n=1 Tax=Jeongeupia chitinilytica TaxID=1041641 RepID=A0ABQ3GUV4_9NEIS|nr:hypothetical protein [Jeongeupia chitinilytica]GHD55328.1 hypothetical protein GCM10007350_00830 [Jeongeupia chitinilytica]
MKRFQYATLSCLVLAACGGSGSGGNSSPLTPATPRVSVDALPAGSYTVATGDADAPQVGQYYTGSDGRRLLVVNDADETASTLYKQDASGVWTAVPAPKADVAIRLGASEARPSPAVDPARLAGSYTVLLAGGAAAQFGLSASGELVAQGNGTCRIAGRAMSGKLPGALDLALTFSGCAGLPASGNGVLLADPDYAPAALRLIADDGSRVIELWAYPA